MREALYRIAHETLNNAAKHADARHATIRFAHDGHALVLEVSDDGTGFDPAESYPGHLGLRTMRERAEMIGAELEIASRGRAGDTCPGARPWDKTMARQTRFGPCDGARRP